MFLKHFIVLAIFTAVILLAHEIIHQGLILWVDLYASIFHYLGHIFTGNTVADWIRKILSFLSLPFLITFIPASLYWCIKRRAMLKEIFWVACIIQAITFCF
jgi:hypothetical protein